MDTERICPSCQKPLAKDVPLGLCPECLIKSGFPTGAESAGAKQPPFIPPTVEELAKLFPQLEILELIGKGGMGAVYKARQPKLNRFVALKILPPSIGSDPAFAERFAREAQALARLNHPGIVILYEFGQAGGLHFFMMEYVDGVNLRQLLINGRIAPREALAIVPQICDALQFAHDQGIVHRDIKPENILLDRRGHVKIADFGLAKIVGSANEPAPGASGTSAPLLTETGKIIGTPQYMSPEQIAHPADVDHRADIYALGVVFYQMLTGELPGKKIEPPSKKVHIDVRLDEVVLRALESNPELRFQQVSEVKTCVDIIVGSSGHESAQTESERAQSGQSGLKSAATNQEPRFSRMAIAGACWAMWCFLAIIPILVRAWTWNQAEHSGPSAFVLVWTIPLLLGLLAPIGTTILGWIAVTQIRRSAGTLYGMWLAVFDGLFSPLLALDAVIFGLVYLIVFLVAKLPYFASSGDGGFGGGLATGYQIALLFLAWLGGATLISILADLFIIRRVWRAVNRPVVGAPSTIPPRAPVETSGSPVREQPVAASAVNKSGLVRVIELVFDITFTSPLAIKLINVSALGFLAFLAFLADVPLPGMHHFLGFSGFSGFFGLIGFAFMVEFAKRRKAKPTTAKPNPPAGYGEKKPAWWLTSPFASPEVQEIVAHMTPAEKRESLWLGALFGIWNAATWFAPFWVLFFMAKPLNNWKLAVAVWAIGILFYPVWFRIMWKTVCSTEWARARGIEPASLRKFVFSGHNIWKSLALLATCLLVAFVVQFSVSGLLRHREPSGIWFPDRINNSIEDPYGEVAVRVTDVTNRGQVVLVKLTCETGRRADDHELLVWFSGPVFDYRGNMAAKVTNVDCLISPTLMTGGGKVLAGSSHLQDTSAHLIGFVLPDEATAARVVEQVRQTHLGKPRGLMDPRSALLLFSLHRRVGEDAKGKPVNEGLRGELNWMLKDVATTQTKTNLTVGPANE